MFKHKHLNNSSLTFKILLQLSILITHHSSDQKFVFHCNYNFSFSSHLSFSTVSTLSSCWKTYEPFNVPIYSLLTLYMALPGATSVFLLRCCTSTLTVFKPVLYILYFFLTKKKKKCISNLSYEASISHQGIHYYDKCKAWFVSGFFPPPPKLMCDEHFVQEGKEEFFKPWRKRKWSSRFHRNFCNIVRQRIYFSGRTSLQQISPLSHLHKLGWL